MDLAEEMENPDIYKIDVLSVMQAFQRIWINLQTSVITNCWRHTGLLGGRGGAETVKIDR